MAQSYVFVMRDMVLSALSGPARMILRGAVAFEPTNKRDRVFCVTLFTYFRDWFGV